MELQNATATKRANIPRNILLREMKVCPYKSLYMYIHRTLFMIARNGNKCPLTEEQINKCDISIYRILFSHKKGISTDSCYNLDELCKHAK